MAAGPLAAAMALMQAVVFMPVVSSLTWREGQALADEQGQLMHGEKARD